MSLVNIYESSFKFSSTLPLSSLPSHGHLFFDLPRFVCSVLQMSLLSIFRLVCFLPSQVFIVFPRLNFLLYCIKLFFLLSMAVALLYILILFLFLVCLFHSFPCFFSIFSSVVLCVFFSFSSLLYCNILYNLPYIVSHAFLFIC